MTGIVRKFVVHEHELGLLFRRGEFRGLLRPGTHWRLDLLQGLSMEVVDINAPAFRYRLQDFLVRSWPRNVRERYEVTETRADQVAVVHVNGQVQDVLGPRQRVVYRKGMMDVKATTIDFVDSRMAQAPLVHAIAADI